MFHREEHASAQTCIIAYAKTCEEFGGMNMCEHLTSGLSVKIVHRKVLQKWFGRTPQYVTGYLLGICNGNHLLHYLTSVSLVTGTSLH